MHGKAGGLLLAYLTVVGGAAACSATRSPDALPESSGAPRGDGVVTAFLLRSRTQRPIAGSLTVTGPGGFSATASSGADGFVQVEGVPRGVPLEVSATSPGLLAWRTRGITIPPTGDFTLWGTTLGKAVPVEGIVVDEEGRPVPGAVVEVCAEVRGDGSADAALRIATATTGSDGAVSIPDVPPGRCRLITRTPGFRIECRDLDLVEGARRDPLRIELEPAEPFEGRVFDVEGNPAAGMGLLLLERQWCTILGSARTDGAGRFRFEDAPRDGFRVAVRRTAAVLDVLGWTHTSEKGPFEFRIPARQEIHGRVLDDASGLPIEGATIWIPDFGGWIGSPGFMKSTPDGTFRITGLPDQDGDFGMLGVTRDGYLDAWASRDGPGSVGAHLVPAGTPSEQVKPLELRLRRAGAVVRGVVRKRDGKPVPHAEVVLGQGDPHAHYWTVEAYADEEGRYRLPPATPGPGVLSVGARGLHLEGLGEGTFEEPVPADLRIVVPESGEVERDFVLVPDSSIEGRMVLADGSPAVGYIPTLSGEGRGGAEFGAPSAEDGSFSIEELLSAERIAVDARGQWESMGTSEPFDIGESQRVTGIVIRVYQTGSVSGRIVGPDGLPVEGSFVSLVAGRTDAARLDREYREYEGGFRVQVPGPTWASSRETADAAADGSFLVERLNAGIWTPVYGAPGFLRVLGQPFELREGKRKSGLVQVLGDPRVGKFITGKVLDAAGTPVEGAGVFAFRHEEPPEFFVPPNLILKPRGFWNADRRADSGAGGAFRLDELEDGAYLVAAKRDDVVASIDGVRAGDAGVVLRFGCDFAVSGRVVDPSGGPVAGAEVTASAAPAPRAGGEEAEESTWFGSLWFITEEVEGGGKEGKAVSGADGSFRVEGLCAGPFRLAATKEGFVGGGAIVEASASDLILALQPSLTIRGRVLESGTRRPVEWAGVTAIGGPEGSPESIRAEATSGPDGSFLLEGLAAGVYEIRTPSDWVDAREAFLPRILRRVQAGAKGVDIEIDPGQAITGRFEEAGGGAFQPEGMTVILSRAGDFPRPAWRGAFRIVWRHLDESGRFEFSGLAPGRYELTLTPDLDPEDPEGPPAFPRTRFEVETGSRDLVLPLARGRTIAGRVEHPAPPRWRLAAWLDLHLSRGPVAGDDLDRAYVDEKGSFVTDPLTEGIPRDLAVRTGGDLVAVARGIFPGATGVVLRLEEGLTLSGTVVGPDGAPLAGARAVARSVEFEDLEVGTGCGPDGTFLLQGLPPGAYRVYGFSEAANLVAVAPVEAVEAGTAGVVARTKAGNEFRARFVLPEGARPPRGGFKVSFRTMVRGRATTETRKVGRDGILVLRGLEEGELRVHASRNDSLEDPTSPLSGTTFGPFEIPCPEQSLRTGE